MRFWSKRTLAGLTSCTLALGVGASIGATPAQAQVTAANTIAPQNTVVAQPKVTTPPAKKVKKAKKSVSPSTVAAPAAADVTADTELPYDGGAEPTVVASASSFSDTIADLAAEALRALPQSPAVVGGGTVAAGGASPVKFVVAPTTVASALPAAPQAVAAPPDSTWTSAIINTDDLAQYVFGVAISAPQSEESKTVLAALPQVGTDRYAALLREMAKVVGPRTKTDPAALESVWLRTDPRRMKAVLTALAQVGTRYVYTGNKPGGFDCSGLTSYAWSQAGIKIPRTSSLQVQGLPHKLAGQMLPGDIVWHPGHVSMYLGVDQAIVDAPQTGKTVEVKKSSPRAWNTFLGVA